MATLLRPSEVAGDLNISRFTVYALIRRGELEFTKVGHQIRIPAAALADYRARQSRASGATTPSAPLEILGPRSRVVLTAPDDLNGLPVLSQQVVQAGRAGAHRSSVRGVLLHTVLSTFRLLPEGDPLAAAGHRLCQPMVTSLVVATSRDGHAAVFSLAELAPEYGRTPVMLVWEREGIPLTEDGPVSIVVPTDTLAGRNIRGVIRIELRQI